MPWMDWKIETWDAGYYQVRNAMKDVATPPRRRATAGAPSPQRAVATTFRLAHDAPRVKLLPQGYSLGFYRILE